MAAEGKKIPQYNEPEKPPELEPARFYVVIFVYPEEEENYTGSKKQVADLVRDQSLCTAVVLHGQSRLGDQ
jgi:hypothetical protein